MPSLYSLQVFSALLNVTSIFCDTKQFIIARPLSIVGILVGLPVYYHAGLYAKCLLNSIFIVFNIYGWYQWRYGGVNHTPLKVSLTSVLNYIGMFLGGCIGTVGLGTLLSQAAHANLVYWDSANTTFALMAQFLTMRKKLGAWPIWVLVSINYTILCFYKGGLNWFGLIHAVYIPLSVSGYYSWWKSYQQDVARAAAIE